MKPYPRRSQPAVRQRGLALFFSLIMLLLMTLIAVTAFRVGGNQTIVVANAQHRSEGFDAAQEAIGIVLNSGNFAVNPAAAIPTSNCAGGGANSWCVDSNGDNTSDFTVAIIPQPACLFALPIPNARLDYSIPDDQSCVAGSQQNFGVSGAVSGNSLCADSNWEIGAQASDAITATTFNAVQGVGMRIASDDMATNCP